MNRNTVVFLILFAFLPATVFSQEFRFVMQGGLGTYRMKDLKEYNSAVFNTLAFQAENVSNYPPYFYYKPAIILSFEKFSVGLELSHYSTGSRISSKDYSGEYHFDTRLRCTMPDIYADYTIYSVNERCNVQIFADAGICFSRGILDEKLSLSGESVLNLTEVFRSKNYVVEPGLKATYEINQFMRASVCTGYAIQFGKEPLKSDDDAILVYYNYSVNYVKPDWSGFRLGISLIASIKSKK